MDVVDEDLKRVGENGWSNIIHDREKWCEVVMAAKTLVEWIKSEKEEEDISIYKA